MDGNGSYLGMSKGCFVLKDRNGNEEKFPLFENEIKEVVLRSGNSVSTGALSSLGFWDVDTLILTQRGRPVAILKSFDDDSHVKTRLCQYEAYHSEKGLSIAKQLVLSKIESQNTVLEKYGLKPNDMEALRSKVDNFKTSDLDSFRQKLTGIEGKFTERYFRQIFQLLPEGLRPERRKKFKAYDGVNNIFNLAYEVLQWKVHRAIIRAKLEPYLGFLHSEQHGKPSLVCDMMELYRYLIDDFLIDFCQGLKPKDFMVKDERTTRKRWGKREYLNASKTRELEKGLDGLFEGWVEVPRLRHGRRQALESLIHEEAQVLARYLRGDLKTWIPRIPS